MENTKENKAKFFAQYYGQRVLLIRDKEEPMLYVGFDDMQNNDVRDSDYLLLKEMKSISNNCNSPFLFDKFRSLGYALPFHGLSVDELVSYGWVKLIKDQCVCGCPIPFKEENILMCRRCNAPI